MYSMYCSERLRESTSSQQGFLAMLKHFNQKLSFSYPRCIPECIRDLCIMRCILHATTTIIPHVLGEQPREARSRFPNIVPWTPMLDGLMRAYDRNELTFPTLRA